jgi:RNA polymerase sporulation-specific sigma factor
MIVSSLWALTVLSITNGISLLASYISNNTFPHPLSEDEEAEFIAHLNSGDDKARHVLTEHNLRLVAHIVKRM